MKIKKNLFKTIKVALLGATIASIALVGSACGKNSTSYLSDEQNNTINSVRAIEGTDNMAFEINYTADYKLDEFIKTITEGLIYSSSDCRKTMQELLAEKSNIVPSERLTNENPGCSSVICKDPEGTTLLGRNYDLDVKSNAATVVIHTAPEGGYKSVGVADCGQNGLSVKDINENTANKELLLYAPYFTMDGINEKGFACSIMVLSEGATVQTTGKEWLPSTLVVRYLLDNADSVDNAIELLENMDFRNDYFVDPVLSLLADLSFHWAITDSTGNKAIIEYVDGKMVVNKYPLKVKYNEADDSMEVQYPNQETGYLLSTNFFVTEGFNNTKHDSGRWRYETLEKQLSENPTPTKDQLKELMKSAKYMMNDKDYMFELKQMGLDASNPDNWDWITIWTDILDTSEKTLTFWSRENYDVKNVFNLDY